MSVFDHPDFDDHEQVIFCRDSANKLSAIIAIHDTTLGPAAGGCRMYPYASTDDALRDVLRLSKGMTYKNAVADLPLGGGKCVIIGDPRQADKANILQAMGRHIQSLGGRYWTAVDVGVAPADADDIAQHCDYVFARPGQYPAGFDTSAFTALGGYASIRATIKFMQGRDDLKGIRVAVQGLGATGFELCRLLHGAGATLIVADVNEVAVKAAVDQFNAQAVSVDSIHAQSVDVFAPCALGAVLNQQSIPELKAKAVCGVANNQLAVADNGDDLMNRGVLYAPDFVVNAGGIIASSTVITHQVDPAASTKRVKALYDTVLTLLSRARQQNCSPSEVANEMAIDRIAQSKAALATPSSVGSSVGSTVGSASDQGAISRGATSLSV